MASQITYKAYLKKLPDDKGYQGFLEKRMKNSVRILRKTTNYFSRDLAITALNKEIDNYHKVMQTIVFEKMKQEPTL